MMRYYIPAAIVALLAVAWAFRYEHLPPTAPRVSYVSVPLAPGVTETVVVCHTDRWTRTTECERIEVQPSAADARKATLDHNDRLLKPHDVAPLRPR